MQQYNKFLGENIREMAITTFSQFMPEHKDSAMAWHIYKRAFDIAFTKFESSLEQEVKDLKQEVDDLKEVIEDKHRLTKEIDVALFGESICEKPSLCDVLSSVKTMKKRHDEIKDALLNMKGAFDNPISRRNHSEFQTECINNMNEVLTK